MWKKSVKAWSKVLTNRLEIRGSLVSEYPPFSDLKTRCVYLVPDYFTDPDLQNANLGLTLPTYDMKNKTFFDSDVFIFEKEYQKQLDIVRDVFAEKGMSFSNLNSEQLLELKKAFEIDRQFVFTHEFGHLLGLDHPFTEKNKKGEYSIMNYESARKFTDYDIGAIQNLYPLIHELPEIDSKN